MKTFMAVSWDVGHYTNEDVLFAQSDQHLKDEHLQKPQEQEPYADAPRDLERYVGNELEESS
jgi:hypothetical protein